MIILPTFPFLYSGLNHETIVCQKLLSKLKNVTIVERVDVQDIQAMVNPKGKLVTHKGSKIFWEGKGK